MSEPTTHPFELTFEAEPERIIRGRATLPAGASSDAPVPFVLVLHGFKGFMNWGFFPELARRLADAGLAAVAFNTSSSGIGPDLESFSDEAAFERDTYSRQLEDCERVRGFVGSGAFAGVDASRGGLFGHSRGGGLGLLHAAEQSDYRAVVTWAAIETTDRFAEDAKTLWRQTGRLPIVNARTGQTLYLGLSALEDFEAHRDRLDIQAACGRLASPVLLVHGTGDEAVSVGAVDTLERALRGETRTLVLEGAGHTFGAVHPLAEVPSDLERALSETTDWFRGHLF
jgi:dipeptidyl aminopeptidase/acylaminoacyl peptidase